MHCCGEIVRNFANFIALPSERVVAIPTANCLASRVHGRISMMASWCAKSPPRRYRCEIGQFGAGSFTFGPGHRGVVEWLPARYCARSSQQLRTIGPV